MDSAEKVDNAKRPLALVAWGLAAVAYISFQLLDLRLGYLRMLTPCGGPGCFHTAISSAEISVLYSWGLSPGFYAMVITGTTAINVVGYWLLAGLILLRQASTRIGFPLALALLAMPFAVIADPSNMAEAYPGLLAPTLVLNVLGSLLLILFLLLFPNGRFVPRWLRLLVPCFFLVDVLVTLQGNRVITMEPSVVQLVTAVWGLLLLTSIGSQVYRYRWVSMPLERLQTKWVVLGLISLILGVPLWGIFFGGWVEFYSGEVRLMASVGGWLLLQLMSLALPATVAIAILRYRLWDIDLIIRRTLIYSFLTAMMSLIFFSSVVILQALFGFLLGDRQTELVTVGSTLAVAALFNPLRLKAQQIIDRRFYRQRYDTQKILSAFNTTLRNDVDLDSLQRSIVGVVEETMRPTSVWLWLREDGERPGESESGT